MHLGVMILTFWGHSLDVIDHVTIVLTIMVPYRWSVVTNPLSRTVSEMTSYWLKDRSNGCTQECNCVCLSVRRQTTVCL